MLNEPPIEWTRRLCQPSFIAPREKKIVENKSSSYTQNKIIQLFLFHFQGAADFNATKNDFHFCQKLSFNEYDIIAWHIVLLLALFFFAIKRRVISKVLRAINAIFKTSV